MQGQGTPGNRRGPKGSEASWRDETDLCALNSLVPADYNRLQGAAFTISDPYLFRKCSRMALGKQVAHP